MVVTGAGRGIGRAHAIALAAHGARVVVNDAGVEADGSRPSTAPADDVVAEVRRTGGEAVASHDDVVSGARTIVATALDAFGRTGRGREQRRDPAQRSPPAHHAGGLAGRLRGSSCRHPGRRPGRSRALARRGEGRPVARRVRRQHRFHRRPVRVRGRARLQRGQGRHRRLHDDGGGRARALRRAGQRDRAGRRDRA